MISRKKGSQIKCHGCGKSQSFEVGEITVAEDFHLIKIEGGYGDEFPQDLESISFDICGTCLKEWVDGFEIPPETESLNVII